MKGLKFLLASVLLVSNAASAQLGGLKNLGGVIGGGAGSERSASSALVSAEQSQDALVTTFKETMTLVVTAQSLLEEAVGNSEDAQALQLVIEDLNGVLREGMFREDREGLNKCE